MEVRVQQGAIETTSADIVVVNLFEGVTAPGGGTGAVDVALEGKISELIKLGDIKGKSGEVTILHTFGKIPAPRVAIVGLGKAAEFDVDAIRTLSANLARQLRKPGIKTVATLAHGAGIGGIDPAASAQAIAEGSLLGEYRFLKHKSSTEERDEITTLTIVEHDAAKVPAMTDAAAKGVILGIATNGTRDLSNEPSNHLYPTDLANAAAKLAAENGLEITVLEEADMEAKGMGSMLSVARGSRQPAKMVAIKYNGRDGDGYDVALVGKGITFDTGGTSIKPAANMEAMKADMTGAATVIHAIAAVAKLKPKANILAVAAITENMPGGNATKPGDVVTAMNGKTIEVINTDAEGRLVLADACCWANELGAKAIVDVATLTGAATTSFGDTCYGIMTNNDALATRVEKAALASGEKTWRLPMFKEYDDYIKSDVADIKNTTSRGAGTIAGAKFIERFVGDTPWVHCDIANVDMSSSDKGWISKGATGYSVRTLINLALEINN